MSMQAEKWQIFAQDFAKEWVKYFITLVNITITKYLIFCPKVLIGLTLWQKFFPTIWCFA